MRSLQVYSCGARTTAGGINLYIEQVRHKLDQIAASNLRMSLDERAGYSELSYGISRGKLHKNKIETKYDIYDKNLPTVLADSSNRSRAWRTI